MKYYFAVVQDFTKQFTNRFGSHVHILDWALHLDEGTPHIHERHVFDCENEYGEIVPSRKSTGRIRDSTSKTG